MKKRVKINGLIICGAVVLLAVFPEKFFRLPGGLPDILVRLAGFATLLCGMLLRVSARGYKSENSSCGACLVQGGPYALVRNPMYLGITLIAAGLILYLFQWWVLVLFALIFLRRYVRLIFKEEKLLEERFGREYAEYAQKVPRIFPSPKSLACAGGLPLKIKWLAKEANSFVPLLIFTLAAGYWIAFHYAREGLFLQTAGLAAITALLLFWAKGLVKKYARRSK